MISLQTIFLFVIVVCINVVYVKSDGRVCLPLAERNGEEEYEVIDYRRITDQIEEKINQVMRKFRQELKTQLQALEEKQENETTENFASIEKRLTDKVTSNESITCPILPNSRAHVPDELCVIRREFACFWFELHRSSDIKLSKAEEICAKKNSTIGVIPDYSVYKEVKEYVVENLPQGRQWVDVLVNLKVDKRSGQVIYPDPDVYLNWEQYPRFSESASSEPSVVVLFLAKRFNGMRLQSLTGYFPGVLCQL